MTKMVSSEIYKYYRLLFFGENMLNISSVLSKLNLRYQEIFDNIIDPYYFTDEPDDTGVNTNIDDGGSDMYDDANCLNTNLTQLYADLSDGNADNDTVRENSIYYTHTQAEAEGEGDYTNPPMDGVVADGADYFGSGSQYFTNMYPAMFVMGATGIDIEEFSITGNIGADGSGDYEVNTFTLTSNGRQFTCFNKQVYNSGDPSINHFIFVPGNGAGIDHLYDDENQDDDDCLQNLTGIDEIYYLLIAKQPDLYMNSDERLAIAQSFLDVITFGASTAEQQYLHPEITFRVKTYDPLTLVSQLPPDGNIENIINQLKNQTVWIPGWPYALKHGDTFTLYGQAASDLKRKLPQLNVGGTILEIYVPEEVNSIFIFTNSNYVDYANNPGSNTGHEANNLMIYMTSEGISFEQFTDISESGFTSVASSADVIIIPELSEGNLLPDLTAGAKTKIQNFVSVGGTLVMFEPVSGDPLDVLNDIFGFSLNTNSSNSPITLTAEGQTLFPSFSSTIDNNDGSDSVDSTSLPVGAVVIYEGSGGNEALVCQIPYGSGKIYILGWDWYDASPQGDQDGGWNNILKTIITA